MIENGRENNIPRFIYTEATAYAISDCLLLYQLTGRQKYLDRANLCAKWISFAIDPLSGGVRTRFYFENDQEEKYIDTSFAGRRIYAFDTAICIEALLKLYALTRETWLLDCATSMGNFLLEKAVSDDGIIVAVYDAGANACIPNHPGNEWSKQYGAFHSKVAQALALLSQVASGEHRTRYLNAATHICDTLIQEKFSQHGYFETSQDKVALHPLAYAAEGLFHVGLQLPDRSTYISVALGIVIWMLDLLEKYPEGDLPQMVDTRDNFMPLSGARFRTNSLAQIVALAADMHRMGHLNKAYFDRSELLVRKILEMRSDGPFFGRENQLKFFRYGYYYHEKDTSKNGAEAKTLSYWTNMFCFHSLYKYHFSRVLDEVVVMVLAGGRGTRSWPLSCETRPKPLSKSILSDRSLLQETIGRYTFNSFISPRNIYIISNRSSRTETCIQAQQYGIPDSNVIVDEGREDSSIRAVFCGLDLIPSIPNGDRLIIVSMSDNIFEPCEAFQAALTTALLVASSRPCVVSIGQPIDPGAGRDARFGHMQYDAGSPVASYEAFPVKTFIEKPGDAAWPGLVNRGGNWAWECGTPVFREGYFRKKVEELLPQGASGKLADDLLSKAAAQDGRLDLIVSLLRPGTKFDDFGVPGKNVFQYFKEAGKANVIRGTSPKVKALCCQGNLVISDTLPIHIYGLTDYLIVDSTAANATVVMPLDKAGDLDNLYHSLGNQRPPRCLSAGRK